MERYWKNACFSSGVVLLAFSVILVVSRATTMLGLVIAVASILLIAYGKRQVDAGT